MFPRTRSVMFCVSRMSLSRVVSLALLKSSPYVIRVHGDKGVQSRTEYFCT